MIGDRYYECMCGSRRFVETVQVKQHSGGGEIKIHNGFKCADCGTIISGQQMSLIEQKRQAQAALKEAQEKLRMLESQNGAPESGKTTGSKEPKNNRPGTDGMGNQAS